MREKRWAVEKEEDDKEAEKNANKEPPPTPPPSTPWYNNLQTQKSVHSLKRQADILLYAPLLPRI
jgi:hypothetical protein